MLTTLLTLLILFFKLSFTMDIPLTQITINDRSLPIEITQKILRKTIKTSGEYIALSLVCKSWHAFCNNDIVIAKKLSKSKIFNLDLYKHVFNNIAYKTINWKEITNQYISDCAKSPFFDIRFQGYIQYAVINKSYQCFESMLVYPYALVRPDILKTIIDNANTKFVDLLKKYSFNFGRYHFYYKYSSYMFYDEPVTRMEVTVSYAKKPYQSHVGEKILLRLIKKTIRYDQQKEKIVKKQRPNH